MEFIEFVEKWEKQENIKLLGYQKEIIKVINKAIKEGKEVKIYTLKSSVYLFCTNMLNEYFKKEIILEEEDKDNG
jgi:hypothetical protein